MGVVTITKENFEAEVVGAKVPVVIDFWASWCGPCQMQSPVVDAVAESMGDQVKVCKVNVDEQPQLALNYYAGIHERWNVSEEDGRVTDAGCD